MDDDDDNDDGGYAVATTFRGNAVQLSKQAAAYAIRQKTQFVGLFDWDSMFLFQFGELDLGQRAIGDSAHGTWVEDESPTFFRKTLLGFLGRRLRSEDWPIIMGRTCSLAWTM